LFFIFFSLLGKYNPLLKFIKGTSKNCFGEVKLSRTEQEQEREVANTGGIGHL
jgi:hypothetical protein